MDRYSAEEEVRKEKQKKFLKKAKILTMMLTIINFLVGTMLFSNNFITGMVIGNEESLQMNIIGGLMMMVAIIGLFTYTKLMD